MKRNDILLLILLSACAVAGYIIGNYGGGIITGVFIAFVIGATVGKISTRRTYTKTNHNIYHMKDIR